MFKAFSRHHKTASFTLVETIMAIGLLAPIILSVASVQGNSVYFVRYGREVSQAVWLAKRMMSQVEYQAANKPFKELDTELSNQDFVELEENDFKYDLVIQNFKLPIARLIARQVVGGGAQSADDRVEQVDDSQVKGFEQMIDSYLGEDIFKLAKVRVSWPEGAKRNTVGLSLILYNEQKLDEVSKALKAVGGTGSGAPTTTSPTPTPTRAASGGG